MENNETTTMTTTEPAQTAISPKAAPMLTALQSKVEQLVEMCGQEFAAQLIANVKASALSNPKIMECTPLSIIKSTLRAASMRLLPNGVEGHLVPYGKDCTFLPGYQGMIEAIWETGQVKEIICDIVKKNDTYKMTEGHFSHNYDPFADRGEMVGAYCRVVLATGGEQCAVMPLDELAYIRDHSAGYKAFKSGIAKSCVWEDRPEEMAKKSCVFRVCKLLPKSKRLAAILEAEKDVYQWNQPKPIFGGAK